MPKRIKKAAVKPELRRHWFRRFEEEGESPPQIAKTDGYDVRTVRKQIELARQEREMRDAKIMVLRQALQNHYVDLYTFARKLDSDFSWPPHNLSPSLRDDRMWQALREHLPRSPIWKAIDRCEQLANQFDLCVTKLKECVRVEVQRRGLRFLWATGEPGPTIGIEGSVVSHVVAVARGHMGLKDAATFSDKRATETDLHEVSMGLYHPLGLAHPDDIVNLKAIYFKLLDEATGWEEGNELRQVIQQFEHQSRLLHDELATIIYRRVVPGRCRYCPI